MRSRPLHDPHPLDYQATILLVVAAGALSAKRLMGFDLEALVMDYRVWRAEPWRLFTSCLLHGSWFHLAFNLVWTLRFGALLEPILGTAWMVALYLFLGVGPIAAQWTVAGPAIGLSGVGYGLFGLLLALDRWDPRYGGVMTRKTAELFGLWFVFCIVATIFDWMPVANTAHGAGVVLGLGIGWSIARQGRRRALGIVALVAASLLLALSATVLRPLVNRSEARAWELAHEAYLALEREENRLALDYLEASLAILPTAPGQWHNLGVALERLGRSEEAEAALRRERELEAEEKRNPPARRSLRDVMPRALVE